MPTPATTDSTRANPVRKRRVAGAEARRVMDLAAGHYEDPEPQPYEPVTEPVQAPEPKSAAEPSPEQAFLAAARWDRLNTFVPRIAAHVRHEVKAAVIGQIALTPYVSDEADDTTCSMVYRFAAYVHGRIDMPFDPAIHMTNRWIDHYIDDRSKELKPGTTSSIRSCLKRVRDAEGSMPMPRKIPRRMRQAPYTQAEWNSWRQRVDNLVDQELRGHLVMLLDLTGEAGLRSNEIKFVTGESLVSVRGITVLRVADLNGEFRDIPLFGAVADRLESHMGKKTYLLNGQSRDRRNVVHRLSERAGQHTGLGGFKAARARHTFIAHLFTQPIPTVVACAVAGINPGSHTPADIVGQMPTPPTTEIVRRLASVRAH